jgi:hypothetical protein
MIGTKILALFLFSLNALVCSSTPMSQQPQDPKQPAYPPVIEASPARAQAAEESWTQFLSEHKLTFTKPDLEPILYTLRSLPAGLANQINIQPSDQKANPALDETQAKDYLRRFIEKYRAVLSGDQRASALALKDLSLITFGNEGNLYRAIYRQMNYPFPLSNGYGELRIVLSKTGTLLQLSSRLLPVVEIVAPTRIEPATITEKLVGREFTYSNIAGQPLTYKVAQASEISIKDLVIYPKVEGEKIRVHLVYPVEVGRGTTWTVYVDAVTGEEVDTKQNFQS